MLCLPVCVLLCFFSATAAQDQFTKCGQSLDLDEDCVMQADETRTDPESTWPWMASVGNFQGSEWNHFCGGVIISKQFVLTAANCVNDGVAELLYNITYTETKGISLYTQEPDLYIRIGDHNLSSPAGELQNNIRRVDLAFFHPEYNTMSRSAYYDISILRVSPSISFASYIGPIALPPLTNELDEYAGDNATVTGWGFSSNATSEDGETLHSVPVEILSQSVCNKTYTEQLPGALKSEIDKHLPELITPYLICTGSGRPLLGHCNGTSGSPLVVYQPDPPHYILLGLVQGRIGVCGDKDFPAIFTRIDDEDIYSFIARETELAAEDSGDNINEDSPDDIEAVDADGNSPLMVSSSRNQYDKVLALLEQGANINHVNNLGQDALMGASGVNGTLKIVDLLLSTGINIFVQDNKGKSALHYAAGAGNLPVVQSLLSRGYHVDSIDQENVTPLMLAAFAGRYGTVKYLLDRGADINHRIWDLGKQPIHFAVMGPAGGSVISLLLNYGADLEALTDQQSTPMLLTFENGDLETTKQLHELGADLEVFNSVQESALFKAARNGNAEHIRWLFRLNGGTIFRRLANHANHDGETPLMAAARYNQLEAVRELLSYDNEESRVDVNHVSALGHNALMYADLSNGTSEIVDLLLNHNINVHHQDDAGINAMHFAAMKGNLPLIKALMAKGVEIDIQCDDNRTPLSYAVETGKYGTVEYLLKQGAAVSSSSRLYEAQPIHYTAVGADSSSVIQLLLDYGADLEAETNYRGTAMYLSFVSGQLSTTQQLYKLGAKVEVFNKGRESVLHKAAKFGLVGHMKWLRGVDGGATLGRLLNLPDHAGKTPLIIAAKCNQTEAVNELLSYGADKTIRDHYHLTPLLAARRYNNWNIVSLLE